MELYVAVCSSPLRNHQSTSIVSVCEATSIVFYSMICRAKVRSLRLVFQLLAQNQSEAFIAIARERSTKLQDAPPPPALNIKKIKT